jgi:hypothetical protein
MEQVGEDQNGNPIFKQATDETGKRLYDTFVSLEGIGLPTGTGVDTNLYFGIEIQGLETIELRLADNAVAGHEDHFTVALGDVHMYKNGRDAISKGAVTDETAVTLVLGAGNDSVYIEQVGGAVEILGGEGNDSVYVSDEGSITDIMNRVVFYGDAHTEEQVIDLTAAEHAARLGMELADYYALIENVPSAFINTQPDGSHSYVDAAGQTVYYMLPVLDPILKTVGADEYVYVNVVVIGSDGAVVEDLVQEMGVQETGVQRRGVQKTNGSGALLYLDDAGKETTVDTGVPSIETSAAGQLLFYTDSGAIVFTDTGIPVIDTDAAGALVYLDANFAKTFVNTGHASFVTDFESATAHLLYIDGTGYKTLTATAIPSLIPVFRTENRPYTVAVDAYENVQGAGGDDHLYINGSNDTADTAVTVSGYELGVPVTDVAGEPVYASQDLDILDPASWVRATRYGMQLTYSATDILKAGEPVVNATGNLVLDVNGHVTFLTAADIKDGSGAALHHESGDPVYVLAGDAMTYFGGEQKIDPETGEALFYTAEAQIGRAHV